MIRRVLLGVLVASSACGVPVAEEDGGAGGGSATGGGAATGGGGGAATGGGSSTGGGGGATDDAGIDAGMLPTFSFFVTSYAALQVLSNSTQGFGGDLRYGETGLGAGLRGADRICAAIAERSMPGSSVKQWRAFLSADQGEDGGVVHAKDRIGNGPWYDRNGRLFAANLANAIGANRPIGCDSTICNDLPNEDGVLNHAPGGQLVDNHDMLTGTNSQGLRFTQSGVTTSFNCQSWTTNSTQTSVTGKPRVGHSWPAGSGQNWMNALTEAGCGAGASLVEMGPPNPNNPTVGSGGGYGGFYCFALTP
ncbi:MAG: hypothetical protein ACOZQL_19240 [Myxococcota bacterium]